MLWEAGQGISLACFLKVYKMEELFQKIEETADAFYQHRDKDGYAMLDQVLQVMVHYESPELNEKLLMAMEALEKRDTVLLADILLYEIKAML